MAKAAVHGEGREDAFQPLVEHNAQGESMATDAFSEQRLQNQHLALDPQRTASQAPSRR
jgi:hypothetical protein